MYISGKKNYQEDPISSLHVKLLTEQTSPYLPTVKIPSKIPRYESKYG